MNAYRGALCGFCESNGREHCPRCRVFVCAENRGQSTPYCAMCAKELKDDLDVALFTVNVHEAPPDSRSFLASRPSVLEGLFAPAAKTIRIHLARRRAMRTFARRTADEIAQWRATAGIRVRA